MTVHAMSPESRHSLSQQLGKYQLVATLGQGGMGTVYLALASGFGEFRKLLVLKELRQDLTRQQGFVDMFMDEAKLAARLAHPNVVQTFEASEVGDRYFLAMEYLDGQSLSTLLTRLAESQYTLPLFLHLQILCDTLAGLHYAHQLLDYDGTSLQVVHRDVSPQNVFVTYHGQVKVVDFGVAKVANAGVKTEPGMFVGKFAYAAPEQVRGSPVDNRTDVFAAGVMLWEAIAGRPFADQPPTPATCRARCLGLEPRIGDAVPDVDPHLARICDRALAVHSEDRFESAWEFRSELQDYMLESGVRVEAAEIGQLMHEVFDAERRTIHARIEQAMRHTSTSASPPDDLSVLQADKTPTTVADLSSLVEISIEEDDHKIQQGAAHSKVTLVESTSDKKRGVRMLKFIDARWVRPLALSASCLLVVLGGWAFLRDRSPERITVQSLATNAPALHATPPPAAVPPQTRVEPLNPAAINPSSAVSTPNPAAATQDRARIATRGAKPQLLAATPGRLRGRAAATQLVHSSDASEPTPVLSSTPDSSAAQRRAEEGSDLVFVRRAPVRIDRESPYR
jgi:serine/threonine protein kinase